MNASKLKILFGEKELKLKQSSEPNCLESGYLVWLTNVNTLQLQVFRSAHLSNTPGLGCFYKTSDSTVSEIFRPMGANFFIKATIRSQSHLYSGIAFK
ncbi:predicted protein [Botrytis cinerea T4]|uniref:Uncharacterized protein n=1 Tax=Botryotinia fuckeliana (strain T4) TaxID=999810 RepID=G2YF22_BOTF4|nr:predicted protein [Botrytis cinerea T4]